jgi:hypothetical protein
VEYEIFRSKLVEKLEISRHALSRFSRTAWVKEELEKRTSYLSQTVSLSVRCWHVINRIDSEPKCKFCGKNVTRFNANKWGYLDFCSAKCGRNSPSTIEKLKQTCRDRYGESIENPYQSEIVKQKIRDTCLTRYGVDCVFKDVQKMKTANLRKYGVDSFSKTPMFPLKSRETHLKRTGYEHQSHSPESKAKTRETWVKNFGVDHPMRNPDVLQKVLEKVHNFREFTLPSGRIVKLQGYEPEALFELLKIYREEDIAFKKSEIVKMTGKITYVDLRGITRTYFPDFYIVPSNKIIEVKSTWTYDNCGRISPERNVNLLKEKSCRDLGFDFEFMIMSLRAN